MASRAEALPRAKAGTRKKKGKAARTPGWVFWLPLLAGCAGAWFAVRYAEVLPLLGPAGLARLRLLAPLAMLAHQPQLGLPEATADSLGQALLYAQFPLYGLLAGLTWRFAGFARALVTVLLLHGLTLGAVLLMAQL